MSNPGFEINVNVRTCASTTCRAFSSADMSFAACLRTHDVVTMGGSDWQVFGFTYWPGGYDDGGHLGANSEPPTVVYSLGLPRPRIVH